MHDATLIAGCIASRAAYERVRAHVAPDDLSPQAALWWPLVTGWYDRDPQATAVDAGLLRARAERELPAAHRATLLGWFDALPACPSPQNAVQALLDVKRYNAQQEHLAAVSSGADVQSRETWERFAALLDATSLSGGDEAFFDARSAFEYTRSGVLIPVAPPSLRNKLGGGLAPGDSVVVYARPEIGKTLLVIAGFAVPAARSGARVLYLGNEEPIARTVQRAVASFCCKTTDECAANAEKAIAAAEKRGIRNIAFRHLDPGTLAQVESAVRATEPSLVIVDQIRNILHRGDSSTVRMEEVQKSIRAMASRYGFAAVSVTQAGDSAEGKAMLTMGDVDSSNTGVPGACDVMIGIGATDSMKETPRRMLSFPKNKIGHTHEGIVVSFDKARNRVE